MIVPFADPPIVLVDALADTVVRPPDEVWPNVESSRDIVAGLNDVTFAALADTSAECLLGTLWHRKYSLRAACLQLRAARCGHLE
jgi:hypothetical protein